MLLPLEIERPPPAKQAHRGDYLPAGDLTTITAVVANRQWWDETDGADGGVVDGS